MRRWPPMASFADADATAGRVNKPCVANCSLPEFSVDHRPVAWGSKRVADAKEVPWLHLGDSPPEPLANSTASTSTSVPPRIAVCLTGQVRTLVHPSVYISLRERLLDHGRHDLFMVLSTGSDGNLLDKQDPRRRELSIKGIDDQLLPPPRALEAALRHLRPLRTRFVLDSHAKREPCVENFATLQMVSWATCAHDVRAYEFWGPTNYDFIFRSRPDIYWRAPAELSSIASRLGAGSRVVITTNDWHMLVPRALWDMLGRLGGVACDQRCNGHANLLLGHVFDDFNEYCLLLSHIATHGGRHLEASHPDNEQIFHYFGDTAAGTTGWLKTLYYTNCPIARWRQPPARRGPGVRIVCQPSASPLTLLHCGWCGPGTHTLCPDRPVQISLPRDLAAPPSTKPDGGEEKQRTPDSPPAPILDASGHHGQHVWVDHVPGEMKMALEPRRKGGRAQGAQDGALARRVQRGPGGMRARLSASHVATAAAASLPLSSPLALQSNSGGAQ